MIRPSHATLTVALLTGLALTQAAHAQVLRHTIDPMLPSGTSPGTAHFATAVQGAGDVNGDGYDDFMVALSSISEAGRVYSGRTGAVLFSIPFVADSMTGLLRDPVSLSSAGDVNGDGKDDFLMAHRGTSLLTHGWQVDVFSGATGAVLRSFAHGPAHDSFTRAQALGDVNGDGHADLLIHQFESGATQLLNIFVVSGVDGAELARVDASTIPGPMVAALIPIRTISDVNGDGARDVILGNEGPEGPTGTNDGQLRVYSGSDLTLIHVVNGSTSQHLGQSAGDAGDMNGDGVGDFFGGSVGPAGSTGSIHFYSGVDASPLGQIDGTTSAEKFGKTVEGIGDINGDGLDEVAVRLLGATGLPARVRVYTPATGAARFTMSAPHAGLDFGSTLAAAGDANGDGMQDLLIGAPYGFGTSQIHAKAYVVSDAPVNGGILCVGLSNSTGKRATLTANSASGFTLAANDVTLNAAQLPPASMGIPIVSRFAGIAIRPGITRGRLCIWGNPVGRSNSQAFMSSATGTATISIDAQAVQFGSTPVAAMVGDTFNFQLWFRDVVGGVATANFTDAVTITYQ